jgi:hypothetical protein
MSQWMAYGNGESASPLRDKGSPTLDTVPTRAGFSHTCLLAHAHNMSNSPSPPTLIYPSP